MIQDSQTDNKRIAKNTIMLYIRMLIILFANLYLSKVVLSTLGVIDYGIYNIVGGFVSMFSLTSTSLSNAIGRFITFSLGKGDKKTLNRVFCTSINLQILMSLIIILLCEFLGVWFLNSKMVIPSERLFIANYIFQFFLVSFVVGLISVPYNALIIAHEKMSAFAYISILEIFLKLLFIYFIKNSNFDKLLYWGASLMLISIFNRLIYRLYCLRKFPESKYHFVFDKSLIKEMGSFAGWNMFGEVAGILRNQGTNMLLNLFYGPIVNAAYGIAMQINSVTGQFYGNFLIAVNPQIIKSYAEGDIKHAYNLVKKSTRFAYLMLLVIILPIFIEINFLLKIWLGNYPNYTTTFSRLLLIVSLIEVLSLPLITLQRATGYVREYQLVVGTIYLLNLPISWVLLKIGYNPFWVFYVAISIAIINMFVRIYMLKKILPISIKEYFIEVIYKVFMTTVIIIFFIYILHHIFEISHLFNLGITFFFSALICFTYGISKSERKTLYDYIKKKHEKKDFIYPGS